MNPTRSQSSEAFEPNGRWASWGGTLLLFSWAAVLSFLSIILMSMHWIPFAAPRMDQVSMLGQQAKQIAINTRSWVAIHVLYVHCGCSNRVLERLLRERSTSEIFEKIVIVGERDEALIGRAESLGYAIEFTDERKLWEEYGLETAPVLMLTDPGGMVRYVGGYTKRKQGMEILPGEMIERLQNGEQIEAMPVYGCAVSDVLKKRLDPTGIKRAMLELDKP